MAVEFESRRVEVPNGSGTKVLQGSGIFGGNIQKADIAVKSFGFDFDGVHSLNIIQVATSISNIAAPFVNFVVECNYLDGDAHDYTGFIDVLNYRGRHIKTSVNRRACSSLKERGRVKARARAKWPFAVERELILLCGACRSR